MEFVLTLLLNPLLLLPLSSVLFDHLWSDFNCNGILYEHIGPINLLIDAPSRAKETIFQYRISRRGLINVDVEYSLFKEGCQRRHIFHAQKCLRILLHQNDSKFENGRFEALAENQVIDPENQLQRKPIRE